MVPAAMPRISQAVVLALLLTLVGGTLAAAEPTWRAGTARAVITPEQPLWMAGYGGRTHPADGKQTELLIRALSLEDAQGHRGVILSSDTLGISQPIYEAVVARMKSQHGLDRSQIMLHASHTHCGPVLKQALYDTYPLDDAQIALIDAYSAKLVDTIVATFGEALQSLEPVTVSRGLGVATFGVNRRTNREADVPKLREANQLVGPVDHSVPVLAVKRQDGSLKAVVFAYACHNTVMDFYKWFGDYSGCAQFALEDRHPGVTAMFVMGCGADQNPLPRRKVELAEQYGGQLADAVDAVLKEGTKPLSPRLQMAVEMTPLALDPLPAKEQLEKMAAGTAGMPQRWATRMLKLQSSGDAIRKDYPYPVQAWRLGEQLWINLGGEVVVDYSLKFKGEYGWDTWVTSYSNDVMAYIPSYRVLLEGGYEGQSSMMVYGQPAERWAPNVEERLANAVRRVAKKANGE
jgi:neutral ceramidase